MIAIMSGKRDEVGAPLVWTPSMVEAEFRRVDTEIASLNRDIYAQWSASKDTKLDAFKDSWRAFVDQWKAYYADATKGLGTGWGGHVDRVQKYGQDVAKWREEFQKLGGTPTGPVPRPPESSEFPWGKVLIGVGIVAGIVTLPSIIKAVKGNGKT